MSNQTFDDALTKAKIALMCNSNAVFFAALCMSLAHVENSNISTAQTDGRVVEYSPQFFLQLNKEERIGLILHEILHCAFLHMLRGESFPDKKKFNMAADYVINLIILDAGFKLPSGGLVNYKFAGMAVEEVYSLLPDPPQSFDKYCDLKKPEPNQADGTGQQADSNAAVALRKEMDEILSQATMRAEMSAAGIGSVPGAIKRHVELLSDPIIPWNSIFARWMNQAARDDYSFRRPNRRFFPDMILPSLYSESRLQPIAVSVDASGSVDDDQFNHFVGNTAYVLKQFRPKFIHFTQFDTKIKTSDKVKTLNDLRKVDFHGRGGTEIDPLMQWTIDNKPLVQIVFTDGGFDAPKIKPKTPVVWIIHDNPRFKAPFGKVIHFNFDDIKKVA